MNGLEYGLLGAVLLVLAASVVMVLRQHRIELAAEREAALSLQHIARTLEQLQQELSTARNEATDSDLTQAGPHQKNDEHFSRHIVQLAATAAQDGYSRGDHRLHISFNPGAAPVSQSFAILPTVWTRVAAQRMVEAHHEAGSVVDLWEHLTGDADHGPSYSDVMGPVFGDALIHAAKLGVMDREQADVLKEWADSTQAIIRSPRGKRHLPGNPLEHFSVESRREML